MSQTEQATERTESAQVEVTVSYLPAAHPFHQDYPREATVEQIRDQIAQGLRKRLVSPEVSVAVEHPRPLRHAAGPSGHDVVVGVAAKYERAALGRKRELAEGPLDVARGGQEMPLVHHE